MLSIRDNRFVIGSLVEIVIKIVELNQVDSGFNIFVTEYLLESSLARFKTVACCFQTLSCLLSFKEGNEWISLVTWLFLPMKENKKFKSVLTQNIESSFS